MVHHGVEAGTDEVDQLVRGLVGWDGPEFAVAVEDASAAADAVVDGADGIDEAEVDIGHTVGVDVDVFVVDNRHHLDGMELAVGRVDVGVTFGIGRPVEEDMAKVAGAGNGAESVQDVMAAKVMVAGTTDGVIADAELDQENDGEAVDHMGWVDIAGYQDTVLGFGEEGEDRGKHPWAVSSEPSERDGQDRRGTAEADMETEHTSVQPGTALAARGMEPYVVSADVDGMEKVMVDTLYRAERLTVVEHGGRFVVRMNRSTEVLYRQEDVLNGRELTGTTLASGR